MSKKIIVIIITLALAIALGTIVALKFIQKKAITKEETKKPVLRETEPVVKGATQPITPPRTTPNLPPSPVDVKKLEAPKKIEPPPEPAKLPVLPENVPTHIDIESLKAPATRSALSTSE